ncbi:phage baseplate assembly protein V [Sphingobacterium multivorum]|uniref:phage baseplate assembly protein V n=1 Tax=Sphingobacterium multivorum TaxID=28454 RepID=UPI00351A2310
MTPKAEPQFGKVVSNTDPLNQGRVQVQFDWQQGTASSEFIRVMSPDAGSSDDVKTNRGFMSVPEVGDQVMVNFVYQHPDRPVCDGWTFPTVALELAVEQVTILCLSVEGAERN